jgi:DNA-binding response OmpR family regulator
MEAEGGRILLVEDHVDTARVFSALLTQDGFDVTVAATLAAALDICARAEFDLLICDVLLPDGDGTTVLQATRKNCPGVAGIVVTGFDEDARRAAATRAGFAEYLVKPLTYADLRAAVLRAMPKRDRDQSTVSVSP